MQRTAGAAGVVGTEGRFIGLLLLLSHRAHILSLKGLKGKGFVCEHVCVRRRETLVPTMVARQGHNMLDQVERSKVGQRLSIM